MSQVTEWAWLVIQWTLVGVMCLLLAAFAATLVYGLYRCAVAVIKTLPKLPDIVLRQIPSAFRLWRLAGERAMAYALEGNGWESYLWRNRDDASALAFGREAERADRRRLRRILFAVGCRAGRYCVWFFHGRLDERDAWHGYRGEVVVRRAGDTAFDGGYLYPSQPSRLELNGAAVLTLPAA